VSTAPDLVEIKEANPPAGTTLYFKIDLNIGPDHKGGVTPKPLTGVFIPNSFTAGSELKLLVFLHGHSDGNMVINEYWTTYHSPKYQIRHTLNDSKQNFVLVAPTLSGESHSGDLVNKGELENYLNTVLEGLKKHTSAKFATIPVLRSIVVAAHSGGGRPMLEIAENLGTSEFAKTVKEFWGFDCLYDVDTPYDLFKPPPSSPFGPGHTDPNANGNPTEVRWFKWAKTSKTASLTMRHATAEPTLRCQNLKRLAAGDKFKPDGWDKILKFDGGVGLSNVTIIESTDKDHEGMVKPQLLKQLTPQP